MPYKSERIKISGTKYDSRIKLPKAQHHVVHLMYAEGVSQREIARLLHISRWLVQTILSSTPVKRVKKKYPKEYWSQIKKRYRTKKQNLYIDGKITIKPRKRKSRRQSELRQNS